MKTIVTGLLVVAALLLVPASANASSLCYRGSEGTVHVRGTSCATAVRLTIKAAPKVGNGLRYFRIYDHYRSWRCEVRSINYHRATVVCKYGWRRVWIHVRY